ncbi:MAG: DUF559 domain-containing protein [Pseudorhizobium pelagicum]|uniref:endonuclease domain-containing protein n=1 Tax=Pseudorhizobium pelagicum TaxID=1509405 RepID=UPI0034611837
MQVKAPSSGPSGHLLPAGEKREHSSRAAIQLSRIGQRFGSSGNGAASVTFSPTGRRWPEGSDEGVYTMQSDDITKRRPGKTLQARKLRREETEEEYRLWSDLRSRRLNGFKFSRQIPLGPYIVDFLCRERRLVVEADGSQHSENLYDSARTRWLNANGYSLLRFWNHEITRERRAVLETILAALNGQLTERCDVARFYPSDPAAIKTTREQP